MTEIEYDSLSALIHTLMLGERTIADQSRKAKGLPRNVPETPDCQLLGCFAHQCKPDQLAAACPVTYVDRTSPPMFLIAGTEDTMLPYQESLETRRSSSQPA
jgi:hypothetical protein